jgi:hypothetical protein
MTTLPLVIAFVATAYIVCCMVRGYVDEKGFYCPITRAIKKYLRQRRERHSATRGGSQPDKKESASPKDGALHIPMALALRILVLLFVILTSAVLFLLQLALYHSDAALRMIMLVDRYWEGT